MQRNYNSLGWRFSQRILRGFVQFLRKLKSKIIQLTLTALNYFKGLEFNMTIFKVLNLVCAQTNSSPLLGGRLQWSEECVWAVLWVWGLSALLPSSLGWMPRNLGCTAVLFCQTRQAGQPSACLGWYQESQTTPSHLCTSPVTCGCQHCGGLLRALCSLPGPLLLRLNSSQGKPQTIMYHWGHFVCPLLATHSPHCSHMGTVCKQLPTLTLCHQAQSPKMSPSFSPYSSQVERVFVMLQMSSPQETLGSACFSVHLYHL